MTDWRALFEASRATEARAEARAVICPEVILTASEMLTATTVACRCEIQNLCFERQDRYGCPPDKGWQAHILGRLGEMALAKWGGWYWSGNLGDLRAADVGRYQARARGEHNRDLILYPSDSEDDVFVLVTGWGPKFVLRGWVWGHEGKQQKYWLDPGTGRPNYFVPQSGLHPMSELPKLPELKRDAIG